MPQAVYDLSDMQDHPIEGKFYNYSLSRLLYHPKDFQIDRIVVTRNKGSIEQHLVKWRGYDETFNSWVDASDIRRIKWITFTWNCHQTVRTIIFLEIQQPILEPN
jgi:''chromo'' (CHRromatin Organisation MOdifier) domain.